MDPLRRRREIEEGRWTMDDGRNIECRSEKIKAGREESEDRGRKTEGISNVEQGISNVEVKR